MSLKLSSRLAVTPSALTSEKRYSALVMAVCGSYFVCVLPFRIPFEARTCICFFAQGAWSRSSKFVFT